MYLILRVRAKHTFCHLHPERMSGRLANSVWFVLIICVHLLLCRIFDHNVNGRVRNTCTTFGMSKSRQATLFQSWGKNPQRSTQQNQQDGGVSSSTCVAGQGGGQGEVIDLCDDVDDEDLLLAMEESLTYAAAATASHQTG